MGPLSTAFRINSSIAFDEDVPGAAADGALLSGEFTWHPLASDDIVYVNPFWGIENYTQAGREAVVGGPLASLGILFASPNLSTYGAEIDPFTDDVAGAAIGYQAFWDNKRRNLVLEIAGRKDTGGSGFRFARHGLPTSAGAGTALPSPVGGILRLPGGPNRFLGRASRVVGGLLRRRLAAAAARQRANPNARRSASAR